ncbi:FAD-dependent oxidoreductase [Herbaspirillum sp. HC18]|nr:FAD-dependent oxidoreductase [Herbaspirillum sp. HC18]
MKPVIIIGAGLAGYTLARELRKLDKSAALLIITADDGGFYSKPMLSNAFAQGKRADQLVSQTAAQMAAQLGATIMTGTRAVAVDTDARTVETSAGTFEYGRLVLAFGARPIRLPINGNGADEVMSVNHVSDYARFRDAIARHGNNARVTILGAGLIGCEFADDLAGVGHQVTLVDPNPLPLSALAAPALSRGLHAALKQRGIEFRLGTAATLIERTTDSLEVTFGDGTRTNADLVLSAVGLRPDLSLAQTSGLRTGRGIAVDAYCRTSAEDVYALGDCAEYALETGSSVLPYVAPLMAAARSIARTLSGQPAPVEWKAMPVIVKTVSFPLALVPPPATSAESGTWHDTHHGERIICRYYDRSGTMTGFGVGPQEANIRQALLGELGSVRLQVA